MKQVYKILNKTIQVDIGNKMVKNDVENKQLYQGIENQTMIKKNLCQNYLIISELK